jgi:hypothetical protein
MIYEYEAPPKPDAPSPDEIAIEVPEREGTAVTVLTHENGMTTYIYREIWDDTAADRLAEFVNAWLNSDEHFLGVPNSERRESMAWIPRRTWETLLHIHDAVVQSPIAVHKTAGRRIVVPMGDGTASIPVHGPGKRTR